MPAALPNTGRKNGNPGKRDAELKFCPKCGHDLIALKPIRYGDLYADPIGDTFWKGEQIKLTSLERLILNSLLTGRPPRSQGRDWQPGHFVSPLILAERSDASIDSINVQIWALRSKFKSVDADFNHIESMHGEGYRWSAVRVHKPIAKWAGVFVLYDDGEVVWRNIHRVFLNVRETAVFKALLDANGEFMHYSKINEVTGWLSGASAAAQAIRTIRLKFEKADPKSASIHTHHGKGYRVVKAEFVPEKSERQKKFAARRATGWAPAPRKSDVTESAQAA